MHTESTKGWEIGVMVVSILLTIVFVIAGGAMVAGTDAYVESFQRWGYPQWSRVMIGLIAVACSVGLWVPRMRAIAAAGIVVTMIGTLITHMRHDPAQTVGIPLLLLVLATFLIYARRDELQTGPGRSSDL
jgi:putative oxidoreductase